MRDGSEDAQPMRAHPIAVGLAALAASLLGLVFVGLAAGLIAQAVQGRGEGLEGLLPLVLGVVAGGVATWPAATIAAWLSVRGTVRDRRTVGLVAVLHPLALVLSYLLARGLGREDAVYAIGLAGVFLAAAGARIAALTGAADAGRRSPPAGSDPGTGLRPGLQASASVDVTDVQTADHVGSGTVPVLATPEVVALVERAALVAIAEAPGEDRTTVGSRVELDHLAPTPVGGTATARVRLESVDGRRLTFSFVVTDDAGEIARGTHARVVVDRDRFLASARDRTAPS